jgi:N-methylhydantoinase B
MGTGHTNDISLTTPCFRGDELVGFLACNSHLMDIGGLIDRVSSTDVFMEGLYLPILKIVDGGVLDETLMAVIRANTRQPVETIGDVYSLMNCNDVGCLRLLEMMDEFGIEELDELADHIIDASRAAVRAQIAKLPKGTWHATLSLDGQSEPIELKAALTISEGSIHVDYTGSVKMTRHNFNVPYCYTLAYTSYALGCIIAHDIPNNAGSLEPRTVFAPEGSILNAIKPAAVISRSQVGLMLPDLVFGCLRQAIPDRVPAESTCALWGITILGPRTSPPKLNDRYQVQVTTTGGMGALPFRDGMSATGFPSGVRGGSIEIFESMSTVIVWRKEYRQDSGGAGRMRGGLGQHIEMENGINEAFLYNTTYERVDHPARGVGGGGYGAAGMISLRSGKKLAGKGQHLIPAGDRVVILSPGGGGIGDPGTRDRAMVEADLANELISPEAARDLYGLRLAAAE